MKTALTLSAALLSLSPAFARAADVPVAAPVEAAPEARQTVVAHDPAELSGGRYALGVLASAAAGSLAAIGVLKGVCGDEICLGGAIGGLVANVAVSPLAAWGAGRAMDGRGELGTTYMGGLMGFGVGGSVTQVSPGAALAVGTFLMPFTSALAFELSSQASVSAAQTAASGRPTLLGIDASPLAGAHGEVGGGRLTLLGRW